MNKVVDGVRAILVKESVDLDYCRCGSYCGDSSELIIETLEADSVEDLIKDAVACLPTYVGHEKRDAVPHLYLITDDLSERVQTAFSTKLQNLKDAAEKYRVEKEQKALKARDEAAIERLRARLAEIESGEEATRLRAELSAVRARSE